MLMQPYIDAVITHAARQCGIVPEDILGPHRNQQVAEARQAVCMALRSCKLSLKEIAHCIHRKDHTTIMYHIEQAAERERNDPQFARLLRELCAIAQEAQAPVDADAWIARWPRIKAALRWQVHQHAESAEDTVESDVAIDDLDRAIRALKQQVRVVFYGNAT